MIDGGVVMIGGVAMIGECVVMIGECVARGVAMLITSQLQLHSSPPVFGKPNGLSKSL